MEDEESLLISFNAMKSNSIYDATPEIFPKDSKRRKYTGRMADVMKKMRLSTHEIGPDCECKRFRCFKTVPENQQNRIIREFNNMNSKDEQDLYLTNLVTVLPILRRRTRKPIEQACLNSASFSYEVPIVTDNGVTEYVRVCYKAFMSFHGITSRHIQTIREALIRTGRAPTDKRGKHNNRPHKVMDTEKEKIRLFLFALKDLKEDLSIKKLHDMYLEENRDSLVKYDSFREIFHKDFEEKPES